MAYGTDVSVYVEDKAGDLGAPQSTPAWLSPDVDIPAHSGEAVQGANQVQVRVHAHDEPILDEKIVAEVYVGKPGFVLSPTNGTKRIDPGGLRFRPANVPGTEPVADETGNTLSFSWTPSGSATEIDGPGHHCLILRAFPESVTAPSSPFDVPNEQHEAQHNIEILTTTTHSASMAHGGAGTKKHPRHRDELTGLWWERFATMAAGKSGRRFVVGAFDPDPSEQLVAGIRRGLEQAKVKGFSDKPPGEVTFEPVDTSGEEIDPRRLLDDPRFAKGAGLGKGLFAEDRLLGAAVLDLDPRKLAGLLVRFDHSNLGPGTAVVMHFAQWSDQGRPEGGMTMVLPPPIDR
jgi:hypothetical protein